MSIIVKVTSILSVLMAAPALMAASPNCTTEGGSLLSWPADEPLWEMCWLPPNQSSGPRGSGLELRAIHYRGIQVARRIHAPMLFAEYSTSTCYRDWKDFGTPTLAHNSTHDQLGVPPDMDRLATTSCSVSDHPTTSYGTCPFQQATGNGYACTGNNGVVIEDLGDHVRLVSQYRADWYMYDSRIRFYENGVIEPTFGFGNNNGTYNGTTHWHHNYWRFDFGIDGQDSHIASSNGVDQAVEFHAVRGAPGSTTWEVRNPDTGRGYQLVPGANDYLAATNESGRGFHNVDVMTTLYKPNEYGDNPSYSLGDCGMNHGALVNGENIHEQHVVMWYRVAVRDSTANHWPPGCAASNSCVPQDSMICKTAGPQLVPFGDWGQGGQPVDEADLSIAAISLPEPVDAGEVVQFEVTVSNAGAQDVSQVQVGLVLPPELSLLTPRSRGATDWSCSQAGTGVMCALVTGQITAGHNAVFQVGLQVAADAADGPVQTAVSVASPQWPDPDMDNNSATVMTTIVAIDMDTIFATDFECHAGMPGCAD